MGRAQLAAAVAEAAPGDAVTCWFLDLYLADQARARYRGALENLSILCQPDLPADEVDCVAYPFMSSGNAELTRDLMQQGHQALRLGGRMLTATDNRRDTWLGLEMKKLFGRVTRRCVEQGTLYLATKTHPLKKLKDFSARFAFRDRGRLIRAMSRPGVFAHRRVDSGARALMEVMELESHQRVLDMGCGSGTVSLAAALRCPGVKVHAIDSNARAVECTLCGKAVNGLTGFTVQLDSQGDIPEPGTYDLFLANPPYYSNFRIAEVFLKAARRRFVRPARSSWSRRCRSGTSKPCPELSSTFTCGRSRTMR